MLVAFILEEKILEMNEERFFLSFENFILIWACFRLPMQLSSAVVTAWFMDFSCRRLKCFI